MYSRVLQEYLSWSNIFPVQIGDFGLDEKDFKLCYIHLCNKKSASEIAKNLSIGIECKIVFSPIHGKDINQEIISFCRQCFQGAIDLGDPWLSSKIKRVLEIWGLEKRGICYEHIFGKSFCKTCNDTGVTGFITTLRCPNC